MMSDKTLSKFIKQFTSLRRAPNFGGAPHKPILLLSIISQYETGYLKDNQIYITPELISTYKNIWSSLVNNEHFHCVFALPFYHLRTSEFWYLVPRLGFEKRINTTSSIKSLTKLNESISHAIIDPKLYKTLLDKQSREELKVAILNKYFPQSLDKFNSINSKSYIRQLEFEILNDPASKYKQRIKELKYDLPEDIFEEEIYLRSHVFKRQVPEMYHNSCAISDLHIQSTVNASLVDACHIRPFSESYDDTITNGISLTPTLHRAFDRGLICIDENYRVKVSKQFTEEDSGSVYSIKQFHDKKIILPTSEDHYPKQENLNWHRTNVFL